MKFELFRKKSQAVEKASEVGHIEKLAESVAENDAELIARTKTFEELYDAIRKIGPVTTSNDEIYVPEHLIVVIESLRTGVGNPPAHTHNIPRVHGIRAKVVELMGQEKIDQDIKN